MTDNMLQFDAGNIRFLMCVRGIAIHKERVLLFNVIGWDWWALPGGRVEIQEKSEDALKREMLEELGADVKVGKLVWIVENFFKDRESDRSFHELGMYYRIKIPTNSLILHSEEYFCKDGGATIRFKWFPLTGLEKIDLRPVFLRKALKNIPKRTSHIVWYD